MILSIIVTLSASVESTKLYCMSIYTEYDRVLLYLCSFLENRFSGHSAFVLSSIALLVYYPHVHAMKAWYGHFSAGIPTK